MPSMLTVKSLLVSALVAVAVAALPASAPAATHDVVYSCAFNGQAKRAFPDPLLATMGSSGAVVVVTDDSSCVSNDSPGAYEEDTVTMWALYDGQGCSETWNGEVVIDGFTGPHTFEFELDWSGTSGSLVATDAADLHTDASGTSSMTRDISTSGSCLLPALLGFSFSGTIGVTFDA